MKQTITIEQLEELSEKGKKRLETWIESKLSPPISGSAYIGPLSSPYQTCYFMTIGQMIEFLFNNNFGPIITSNDTAFYWIVEPEKKLLCWKKESYENPELCDALWEAVKNVLDKP